ncbi:MAG: type II toxin-antitoxin system HicB family antitoxin [Ferruginibacter sp.]
MKSIRNFTAIIEKEDTGYTALCPELDIASQGDTVEDAKLNLHEAIELFFEHASNDEIVNRLKADIFITNMQIEVGQA